MKNEEYWQRKIIALLHDLPSKCFDVGPQHEIDAESMMIAVGITEQQIKDFKSDRNKDCDHFASAADRFVFPQRRCSTKFNGKSGSTFIHPLSGEEYEMSDLSHQHIHEILLNAVGSIDADASAKDKFFLLWRRWMEEACSSESHKGMARHIAYLPADSRIPDHSIWNHTALASATQGCRDQSGKLAPALLIFQLGPVQDFIAQARSTRDLWSGSYMLSWLTAHGMKKIADELGPDHIVFPSLKGQGLFDALYKEELYDKIHFKGLGAKRDSLWERMYLQQDDDKKVRSILSPTLPNRFLALVPAERAEELARQVEESIKQEMRQIAAHTWSTISSLAAEGKIQAKQWQERFDSQVEQFLQTNWQIMPWQNDIEKAIADFALLPVNSEKSSPAEQMDRLYKVATESIPEVDRDPRYYRDKSKTKLNNPGFNWPVVYARAEYQLSARRNTRDFSSFRTDDNQKGSSKDSLSGKEEIIGTPEFWEFLNKNSSLKDDFKTSTHMYGAINLIKRLWCSHRSKESYLQKRLGLSAKQFKTYMRFESLEEVAANNINKNNGYIAVMAMDGDEMGKWISGSKTPAFLQLVSEKAREYLKKIGVSADLRRLLSPSYHMQFSETLANFSTKLASVIVEHHQGQLVYAGGDDVLALLPSTRVIDCAQDLRAAFRGIRDELSQPLNSYELNIAQEGFVSGDNSWPLMVPGPKADVSCGIVIGHYKAPLQMLVKEAQIAEKRAKNDYARGAFALNLYKRSGEILHWGSKWDNGHDRVALKLFRLLNRLQDEGKISGRFPYAMAQLLAPYTLEVSNSHDELVSNDVILCEVDHVIEQQGNFGGDTASRDSLRELMEIYLYQTGEKKKDFLMLFLAETFINRNRGED